MQSVLEIIDALRMNWLYNKLYLYCTYSVHTIIYTCTNQNIVYNHALIIQNKNEHTKNIYI